MSGPQAWVVSVSVIYRIAIDTKRRREITSPSSQSPQSPYGRNRPQKLASHCGSTPECDD
jgi:hypothetical protein